MKIAVLKNSAYSKKHVWAFSLRFLKLYFTLAILWNIPGGYCKSKDFLVNLFVTFLLSTLNNIYFCLAVTQNHVKWPSIH